MDSKSSVNDHRPKWILQFLLNGAMFSVGLANCIRGPTLIKLQELYDTDLETISYMFFCHSLGGFAALILWTICLDKLPRWRFLIFGFHVLMQGISALMTPHGSNVLCMELWRGLNAGPYMHSLHLSFSIGGFLAPILSKPFIGDIDLDHPIHLAFGLAGVPSILFGIGFFVFAINKWEEAKKCSNDDSSSESHPGLKTTIESKLLVILMFVFFLIYVSIEVSIICFLPAVAVKSSLEMDEEQGANVLALFLGGFSIARALGILLSCKLKAHTILMVNLAIILTASTLLTFWGHSAVWIFNLSYGLSGLGMGSMFANAWVWLEQFVPVGYRVANLFNLGAILACTLSPMMIGSLVHTFPMILIYLQSAVVIGACSIFAGGTFLGHRILLKNIQMDLVKPVMLEKM
eukprot:maker-scaffold44_size478958-snap-gene-3.25 protein:Tk06926 transcript:maker-scaffold44_size478958-snap-gene-3.25-mRNA-1 annotation:"sodium-dependent glucose transporter 1"